MMQENKQVTKEERKKSKLKESNSRRRVREDIGFGLKDTTPRDPAQLCQNLIDSVGNKSEYVVLEATWPSNTEANQICTEIWDDGAPVMKKFYDYPHELDFELVNYPVVLRDKGGFGEYSCYIPQYLPADRYYSEEIVWHYISRVDSDLFKGIYHPELRKRKEAGEITESKSRRRVKESVTYLQGIDEILDYLSALGEQFSVQASSYSSGWSEGTDMSLDDVKNYLEGNTKWGERYRPSVEVRPSKKGVSYKFKVNNSAMAKKYPGEEPRSYTLHVTIYVPELKYSDYYTPRNESTTRRRRVKESIDESRLPLGWEVAEKTYPGWFGPVEDSGPFKFYEPGNRDYSTADAGICLYDDSMSLGVYEGVPGGHKDYKAGSVDELLSIMQKISDKYYNESEAGSSNEGSIEALLTEYGYEKGYGGPADISGDEFSSNFKEPYAVALDPLASLNWWFWDEFGDQDVIEETYEENQSVIDSYLSPSKLLKAFQKVSDLDPSKITEENYYQISNESSAPLVLYYGGGGSPIEYIYDRSRVNEYTSQPKPRSRKRR